MGHQIEHKSEALSDTTISDGCLLALIVDTNAAELGLFQLRDRLTGLMLGTVFFERDAEGASGLVARMSRMVDHLDDVWDAPDVAKLRDGMSRRLPQAATETARDEITFLGVHAEAAMSKMKQLGIPREQILDALIVAILIDVIASSPQEHVLDHVLDLQKELPLTIISMMDCLDAEPFLRVIFDEVA